MSTYLTLEDGRNLGVTDGGFDCIIELVASELDRRDDVLPDLAAWLLDQRCEVQGFGVGYLDLRELSPRAAHEFREAFLSAYAAADLSDATSLLRSYYALLRDMWTSIARGEPPEALTSTVWPRSPPPSERRGPGW